MLKLAAGAIVAMFVAVPLAAAQTAADPALLQQGQQLYDTNCAVCHQPAGEGVPPTFPALAGNANLADVPTIVTNIHQGKGAMPPFPTLTAEEIAALATYVRNSFGNSFGGVTPEEVETVLAGLGGTQESKTIWEGVYTSAQADRGAQAYAPCAICHGRRLNGAPNDPDMLPTPPLARAPFLREWNGKSIAALFEYTKATMPQNNPGYLSDQEYVDIIAYMLSVSEAPVGAAELPTDPAALAGINITQQP